MRSIGERVGVSFLFNFGLTPSLTFPPFRGGNGKAGASQEKIETCHHQSAMIAAEPAPAPRIRTSP
jgi:hypothetical protein